MGGVEGDVDDGTEGGDFPPKIKLPSQLDVSPGELVPTA